MAGKPIIHYTWNVKKCIEFAKSWLDHYDVSKKDTERVFSGTSDFVKKYSKKPPKNTKSSEIEKIAYEDAKTFRDKIEKRLRDIDPPLKEKHIEKVLGELPDGEDLTDLVLSYRIFDTEDRIRVRKPPSLSVKLSDINILATNKSKND